jgi:prolyl-tRNA editing enzyme YbaK/EbsC (Cys-tRNA(Pro) deacylase)
VNSAEEKVIAALDETGIPYEVIEIDPAYSDTVEFCPRYGYPAERTCNTIIVCSKREPKQYAACVVLAGARLDVNKRVKNLLGVHKVSFASAEEMAALTGMEVGGVTPLSLPPGLPLFVDAGVMAVDWLVLGGGGRSIKIKVSPEVFRALGTQVIEGLALKQDNVS